MNKIPNVFSLYELQEQRYNKKRKRDMMKCKSKKIGGYRGKKSITILIKNELLKIKQK